MRFQGHSPALAERHFANIKSVDVQLHNAYNERRLYRHETLSVGDSQVQACRTAGSSIDLAKPHYTCAPWPYLRKTWVDECDTGTDLSLFYPSPPRRIISSYFLIQGDYILDLYLGTLYLAQALPAIAATAAAVSMLAWMQHTQHMAALANHAVQDVFALMQRSDSTCRRKQFEL